MEKLKKILFSNLSTKQIIFKNAFWLYFSEIISKGFRLLVFIYIIKILGPKNFGIFEYLLSFVGMFFLFADFGISNIFIRDYQQKEEKEKHINVFFTLKIFLSLIFSILALSGYFLAKKFDGFLFYSVFVLFYFLMNVEGFFETFFIALQKTEKKFIFNFLMSLSLFLFVIFGLYFYKSILAVIIAYLVSVFLGIISAYFLLGQEAKVRFLFDKSLIRYYLFNGLPLVLFGLLGYIFFTTDKIILAHLRPIEEVGHYSLASRILTVFFAIPSLFNTALYPYLSQKIGQQDKTTIKSLFNFMISISIITGFLIAFLIFISAPIIPLFFGNQYIYSIKILQSFVWLLIFVFPTIFLDYFLISHNKQWLDFWITLVPATLNVILNFILIPIYGVFGAVYASISAQFINFVLTFLAAKTILKQNQKS
ncbi:MAG: O-unit flippase [Candidatus Parcubacteria bacterium]|nr:MAG: O-unit flippase [Candidatus Parcubacteria bacterium]